jgi:hypothetical protein
VAVAPSAGVEVAPDGDGRPVGDGGVGLCWLGPALGVPADADGVAEALADAELLAGAVGEGVGEGS